MSYCVNDAAHLKWRLVPQLVDELRACGPGAVVDMDLAAQRESLVWTGQRQADCVYFAQALHGLHHVSLACNRLSKAKRHAHSSKHTAVVL